MESPQLPSGNPTDKHFVENLVIVSTHLRGSGDRRGEDLPLAALLVYQAWRESLGAKINCTGTHWMLLVIKIANYLQSLQF